MKKNIVVYILIAVTIAAISGCVSFVEKEEQAYLQDLEKNTYILLKKISINGSSLKKGTKVRLILSMDKSWIKFHCIKADEDPLKAHRFLVFYMFEDEFPKKKYKKELFMKKFSTILALYKRN